MRSKLLALGVISIAYACQRDWNALRRSIAKHHGHSAVKRDVVEFPPVLTEIESILVNSYDSKDLDSWSYYYTHGDHLGGHNRTMAVWTMDQWTAAGFDTRIEECVSHIGVITCANINRFWIWYTAPIHTSLVLTRPDGSTHEVSLIEDMLDEDPTTSYPNRIPAYHAMSASGNITAEYVYVGYVTTFIIYRRC